ncbi:unnamed protein product (macronuclear) [Paramecium tetraurelia]|uniref:RNA helicase n=1 Tax=Paramecium tetraurelia TaxID=5888 RepID=A0CML2_PARTE|nr:uncharacterized protein GSPATT00008508001 [Paramecium tetraurelia]CAK72029.1 unnamed protein product [Paramecium tetraurelia]|eukprot:XP_001439426.1 hypothetical protein (macronuclear) [Paramecium tetraurelia strain d4-2]
MYRINQNDDPEYDQFDPDNLDIEEVVRQRWKQSKGNLVGMQNNRLPSFRKRFIDPIVSQTRQVEEFLKENAISFKTPDGKLPVDPFLTWESINLPLKIKNVIDELKFRNPTPIQSVVFPLILSGNDVIGVAETGSGKTFGYLLPGLIQLSGQNYPNNFRSQINGPEMLILAPTRELVMQITQQVQLFVRPGDVANAFGGQNRDLQAQQIRQNPTILVACPGRLKDFLDDGIVNLSKVTYLVIDEADRLLDMGFEDDVREIVSQIRQDRQTVFFSATWPKAVRNLSFDFCAENPVYVQVGRSNLTINKNIDQEIICLYNNEKLQTLLDILDQLKITDKVLIFAETRISCEKLSVDMTSEGYYAVALHGDKTQKQRDEIMSYYKKGDTKLLCATDLAQRGLDVSDITVVINYDFPKYIDDYIHRIGRTGRAGRRGRAFSFFSFERDTPQMARELLKLNNIHQIKFNYKLMEEIANGIKQFRDPNTQKGQIKYGTQLMTHQNNSKFRMPNLTQEERANLYMQSYQYDNLNRQKYDQGYDYKKHHHGQYNNNRFPQREENFYQQQFRNQGYHNQRRQQQQNYRPYQQHQQGEQSEFQRQRREDYLDPDRGNGRQENYRNQQPRFGNQGHENQRRNYGEQNNQYESHRKFQDDRTDQFDQNRYTTFQYPNKELQSSNMRDQQQETRNQYRFDQSNNDYRGQTNTYPGQSNQNFRGDTQFDQQTESSKNYRDQQYQYNYRNQYDHQQPYGQMQGFNNQRDQHGFQRNQHNNQRQQNNWNENNNNKQGYPQRPNDQQFMNPSFSGNSRDKNFDYQNRTNNRSQQDDIRGNQNSRQQRNYNQEQDNEKLNYQYNDQQRRNNYRNFVDVSKPLIDEFQMRADQIQQPESIINPDFNNFKFNQGQSQEILKHDQIQNPSQNTSFQPNQEQNRRFNANQEEPEKRVSLNAEQPTINRFYDNQRPNPNIQLPQAKLEQQTFNQQFEQKQPQNNFFNKNSQNQPQLIDQQNNQNQVTVVDQKIVQSPKHYENSRQNNERPNFIQQQFQNNSRPSQNDYQSFNRNERIQDESDEDDNQYDFTRYSRQVNDNLKKPEPQAIQRQNQNEGGYSWNNSNKGEIQDSEKKDVDSQAQY